MASRQYAQRRVTRSGRMGTGAARQSTMRRARLERRRHQRLRWGAPQWSLSNRSGPLVPRGVSALVVEGQDSLPALRAKPSLRRGAPFTRGSGKPGKPRQWDGSAKTLGEGMSGDRAEGSEFRLPRSGKSQGLGGRCPRTGLRGEAKSPEPASVLSEPMRPVLGAPTPKARQSKNGVGLETRYRGGSRAYLGSSLSPTKIA